MTQKAKGIAARRAHRQRKLAHARDVISHVWGDMWKPAYKYADNMCKCSCPMCNSGDPHDHRQFRRADAKQAFDLREYDA
jgi:hypothetical protein